MASDPSVPDPPVPPVVAYVPVAGLRVPATLVPTILAAMRDEYPHLADLSDNAVVRGTVHLWVTDLLGRYALRQGAEARDAAVEEADTAATERTKKAHAKAMEDAASIKETTG